MAVVVVLSDVDVTGWATGLGNINSIHDLLRRRNEKDHSTLMLKVPRLHQEVF